MVRRAVAVCIHVHTDAGIKLRVISGTSDEVPGCESIITAPRPRRVGRGAGGRESIITAHNPPTFTPHKSLLGHLEIMLCYVIIHLYLQHVHSLAKQAPAPSQYTHPPMLKYVHNSVTYVGLAHYRNTLVYTSPLHPKT
jgi:hypothetical protein